jgi:DNA repair protein RecN (Recombination protein N)
VKADGGSRALVNDQSASVALLRELGAMLVEIHGQHDDRGLLNPRGHRALLDSFGRLDTREAERSFRAWGEAEAALARAREDLDAAARDREWLEHAVAELGKLAPEPGEEEELAGLRATMQKGRPPCRGHCGGRSAARRLGRRPLPPPSGGAAAGARGG